MKPYPKYKDSGVEWIGKMPENWGKKNLKYAVSVLDSKRIPLSSAERAEKKGNIPYYGATGIIDYVDDYIFEGKHILIGEDGAPFFIDNKDVSFIVDGLFWVNNHAHILKAKVLNIPEFISHYLNSVDYRLYITGSTRNKLTQEDLSSIKFVSPPFPEQKQIAKYLDHKAAKIDSLIEKKKRLIELLKEERTAVINQAVTKGLDPNVPMKDSGIEWLGEIPQHWEVISAKHLEKNAIYLAQTGPFGAQLHASDYVDEGIPLILISNVNHLKINHENSIPKIHPEKANQLSLYRLEIGDIVFSRVGSIGRVALVTEHENGWLISGQMLRLRFKSPKINPHFAIYSISSSTILRYFDLQCVGTTRDSINTEILNNMLIPLPPSNEQIIIIKHIEKETTRIDSIISKSEKEIALLQEYRTTLISEVVTGKIDVREEKI